LNDFSEKSPDKFRAIYTVKVSRGPRICRQSFTQDSLREEIEIINPWRVRNRLSSHKCRPDCTPIINVLHDASLWWSQYVK